MCREKYTGTIIYPSLQSEEAVKSGSRRECGGWREQSHMFSCMRGYSIDCSQYSLFIDCIPISKTMLITQNETVTSVNFERKRNPRIQHQLIVQRSARTFSNVFFQLYTCTSLKFVLSTLICLKIFAEFIPTTHAVCDKM